VASARAFEAFYLSSILSPTAILLGVKMSTCINCGSGDTETHGIRSWCLDCGYEWLTSEEGVLDEDPGEPISLEDDEEQWW
jgi:hypothetical protein